MNRAGLTSFFLLAFFLLACGSSTPPKKLDGVWSANLQSGGNPAYTFSATLTQNSGSTVDVTGFNFTSAAPCFSSPTGQTATFSVSGKAGGFQVGTFGMNISTIFGTDVENVLTLNGTRRADGTISGTWTLTGLAGCSSNGNYTMAAPKPL